MALIYHFTSGVNAGGTGPWDTGRSGVYLKSNPTTRQQMFDAIVEALSGATGAGWTETAASSASSRVFTSSGESGNESLVVTLQQGPSTDVRYVQFGVAPKVDASGNAEAAILFGPNAPVSGTNNDLWDFNTSDFTFEFQILATLDFIWVFATRQSNQQAWTAFAGKLKRNGYNTSVLNLNSSVTAGSNVLVPTSVNPATLGFRIGDTLTITEEDPSSSPNAEVVTVVGIESGGFRVLRLANNYSSTSRIGVAPNPIIVMHVDGNHSIDDVPTTSIDRVYFRSPFRFRGPNDNLTELHRLDVGSPGEFSGNGQFALHFLGIGKIRAGGSTNQGFGASSVPEVRTGRFLCTSIQLLILGSTSTLTNVDYSPEGGSILGLLPSLYSYPGLASFFPHDNFLRNKLDPTNPEDYVPVRFAGSSTGSDEHYVLGPTPGA